MKTMIELALRRQFDEAQRHALTDPAKAEIARVVLQAIIDGTSEAGVRAKTGEKDHKPKVDLAEERRAAIEDSLRKRGFEISVPKLSVSNTALKRWRREGRELFYRPSTSQVSYEAWMTTYGQANHWTVINTNDRAKIGWENASAGYWFLVEVAPACPRMKTSWNDLTASIKLLCLEEYVIAYWTHRDLTGQKLDINTWCWLRTRCGQGALDASGGGEVRVLRLDAGDLAIPYDGGGGRAVEVVN